MESDDTIRLALGLGFQDHHLVNSSRRSEQKKPSSSLDDHQQQKPFSFLSLALSETKPRSEDDHHTNAVRDKGDAKINELNKAKTVVTAAAASSLTAVSSWTSKTMSDEDEDCTTPKKKLRLSKEQISILENTFKTQPTLNPKDKHDLAAQLNLRPRQVEVWFQNRRARIKMKQTEVDRESLRIRCEFLREENRRLQNEVMEFKSLTQAMTFPIQFSSSPSPSIPMCSSCEEGTGRSSSNPNGDVSPPRSFFSSSTGSNNTSCNVDFANQP